MSKQFRNDFKGSLIIPVGWLFADLLLALAMLFLLANTIDTPNKAKSIPTPTPTMMPKPTAIPTPTLTILNTVSYSFCLTVDYQGLLNGSKDAKDSIKSQLRADPFLKAKDRRAGLVIPYGGVLDINQEKTGLAVADSVVGVLKELGKEGFVFIGTAFHDSVHYLGEQYSFVELQVYLYAQSDFTKPPQPPPGNVCPP